MTETGLDRNEAKALYKAKTGHDITFNGLFYLADRHNFLKKSPDGFHYVYLKEKMVAYLNQVKKPIPDGYLTLVELAKKYDISYSYAYKLSRTLKAFEFESGLKKTKPVKAFKDKEFKRILDERERIDE